VEVTIGIRRPIVQCEDFLHLYVYVCVHT